MSQPPGSWPPPPGQPWPPPGQPGPPPPGQPWPPPAGLPGPYHAGPPQQKSTSPLAIVALVLAFIPLLSFVGLVRERGRGLAIAAVIVSLLWVVVYALIGAAVNDRQAERDRAGVGQVDDTVVGVEDLRVGDCLIDLPDGRSVRNMSTVTCAQPHTGEIAAEYEAAAGPYPGAEALQAEAEQRCVDPVLAYAPGIAGKAEFGLFTLVPTEGSWNLDDRNINCVISTETGRTGSLRGR